MLKELLDILKYNSFWFCLHLPDFSSFLLCLFPYKQLWLTAAGEKSPGESWGLGGDCLNHCFRFWEDLALGSNRAEVDRQVTAPSALQPHLIIDCFYWYCNTPLLLSLKAVTGFTIGSKTINNPFCHQNIRPF